MKFEPHKFSRRFPAINCAIVVVHEKSWTSYETFRPRPSRATAAAIIDDDGMVYIGVTLCAEGDQFVKKIGRQKAIGRAARAAFLGKNDFSDESMHPLADPTATDAITGVLGRLKTAMKEKKRQCGLVGYCGLSIRRIDRE